MVLQLCTWQLRSTTMISFVLTSCGVIKLSTCFRTVVTLLSLVPARTENLSAGFVVLCYLWSDLGVSTKLVNSILDMNLSFQKPI